MRRGFLKKCLTIALIAAMTAGLCACGDRTSKDGSNGKKGSAQDSSLAKQYVYSYDEFEMPNIGDDIGVLATNYIDGTIYILAVGYNYDSNSENDYRLLSINTDGSIKDNIQLELPSNNSSSNNIASIIESDVDFMQMTAETVAEVDEEAAVDDEKYIDDSEYSGYEYTNYYNYVITAVGNIYAVRTHYKEDYSDPENPVYLNEFSICRWNMDGSLSGQQPLDDLIGENGWLYMVSEINNGELLLLISKEDGNYVRVTMSADGEFSAPIQIDGQIEIWNSVNSIVTAEDGTTYILYNNQNDNWNSYIVTYDFESDTAGEAVKLPGLLGYYGFNSVTAGYDTDLIFSMSGGLYGYNIGDEDATQIMSCINSDLPAYSLYNFRPVDEEHFIAFYSEYNSYKMSGAYFTKVDPEDIPDKQVIVMAATYMSSDIKSRIIEFNKKSSEYRIVTKEYDSYNSSEDYNAGYTKLNNDIITGNMPDILVTDSNTPVENYISKGLLANVDELIKNDPELKDKEFMDNVFEAYRVDGKLYQVVPSFYVQTFIGKTSVVGSRSTWTMDEFNEVVDSLPAETKVFGEYTRDSFLWIMMMYSGRDFVDVSTGKCAFDSDNFIKMLEYANTLPEELGDDYYTDDYWQNYDSQYRENRTMLMGTYISAMNDMSRYINGYFGEPVSFIGFPTDSGQGGVIGGGNNFVLSSKSANIDGAWEFVRYYLTDEYQDNLEYQIPVSKKAYDEWAAKGKEKPYYIDQNGDKQEYDNTFYMNGEEIPLPVLTQDQIDDISAYIQSVNKLSYYNEDVMNIVNEESAAYFAGQKSARDVASIIQSRVQIYVNENR